MNVERMATSHPSQNYPHPFSIDREAFVCERGCFQLSRCQKFLLQRPIWLFEDLLLLWNPVLFEVSLKKN